MAVFDYNSLQMESLTRSISMERLGGYVRSCSGDVWAAIRLYEKNTELSEALYGVLQAIEVSLRNAMHRTLSTHFGSEQWFFTHPFAVHEKDSLARALESIGRAGKAVTPGRIVAELPFGFWVALTSRVYSQSLWIPCLHRAFAQRSLGHRIVNRRLDEIRRIRNRVAHHEPILRPDLGATYQNSVEVLEWICPDTAHWMRATTRFECVFLRHFERLPGPQVID